MVTVTPPAQQQVEPRRRRSSGPRRRTCSGVTVAPGKRHFPLTTAARLPDERVPQPPSGTRLANSSRHFPFVVSEVEPRAGL